MTRVVTPGTVVEPALLDSRRNNYLASLVIDGDEAGIAYVDITTSEFATTQLPLNQALPELERLRPSEIIAASGARPGRADAADSAAVTRLTTFPSSRRRPRQTLLDHFGVASLEGYGCARLPLAVRAAGAIVQYIRQTQKTGPGAADQAVHLLHRILHGARRADPVQSGTLAVIHAPVRPKARCSARST